MPFRVPKIKGCCCLSLETATKIIGSFHLIFFVLTFSILMLHPNWFGVITSLQDIVSESLFLNFGWCALVMLYGAVKKDHVLMFPWIVLQMVFFLLFFYSIFIQVVYYGLMDTRRDTMVFETILSCTEAYTLMIVYNHYRELKEQRPEASS